MRLIKKEETHRCLPSISRKGTLRQKMWSCFFSVESPQCLPIVLRIKFILLTWPARPRVAWCLPSGDLTLDHSPFVCQTPGEGPPLSASNTPCSPSLPRALCTLTVFFLDLLQAALCTLGSFTLSGLSLNARLHFFSENRRFISSYLNILYGTSIIFGEFIYWLPLSMASSPSLLSCLVLACVLRI